MLKKLMLSDKVRNIIMTARGEENEKGPEKENGKLYGLWKYVKG